MTTREALEPQTWIETARATFWVCYTMMGLAEEMAQTPDDRWALLRSILVDTLSRSDDEVREIIDRGPDWEPPC